MKSSNKVGRPPKYKKAFCEMLINHMAKGFSYESFAGKIGTHRSLLYQWEKKHPEFLDAKKKAFDQCLVFWEEMGHAGTVGKLKGFQTAMWIFQMKNRFRWADRHEQHVEVAQKFKEDVKVINKMSAEELASLAENAAKYLKSEKE